MSAQLFGADFWGPQALYEDPPAQHHSSTSEAAAKKIKPTSDRMRQRVFNCIEALGPITDEEIASTLAMNPSTARPRRVELLTAGRIRQSGKKKTSSGREAAAWEVAS